MAYLIGHNHHFTVPHRIEFGFSLIRLLVVQSQDLQESLHLRVVHDLSVSSPSNVQHFATQWKYAITVSTNHAQSSDRQGLRRITFRQNESAIASLLRTCIIRIFELPETLKPPTLKLLCHRKTLYIILKSPKDTPSLAHLDLSVPMNLALLRLHLLFFELRPLHDRVHNAILRSNQVL